MLNTLFKTYLGLVLLALSATAYAGDFQWNGVYRFEAYHIKNSEFTDRGHEKDFILHHLVLSPRIEAADGVTIRTRFHVFNNTDFPNSQMGAVFGGGPGDGSPTSVDDSNAIADNQAAQDISVSQLYLTLVQEHGALIAGRAPLHFGLGINKNAGEGMFDHWYDNRDIIGYKFVMGNFFLMPMYGKISEKTASGTYGYQHNVDDVNDIMVQLQYENLEDGTQMGLFYQGRSARTFGNDTPIGTDLIGGATAVYGGDVSLKDYSVFYKKDTDVQSFGIEASWQEGEYGVLTGVGGEAVTASGLGVAIEYERRPLSSKFKFGFLSGYATGDDPETDSEFEGFIFDRNYKVGSLLFRHSLGQANLLRTGLIGGGPDTSTFAPENVNSSLPNEAVSNVIYFAPYVTYKWSDKWNLDLRLVTGWLETSPIAGEDVDKSLGYELDFSFNFKPNNRVQWVNELGLMFPGSAFKAGDTNDFETSFGYGFTSKAAISF